MSSDDESNTTCRMSELKAEEINMLDQFRYILFLQKCTNMLFFSDLKLIFNVRDDPEALTEDLQAENITESPTLSKEGQE
jgi:hypothetical protein